MTQQHDWGLGESIFDRYIGSGLDEENAERPVEFVVEVPSRVVIPASEWMRGTGGYQSSLWNRKWGMGCVIGHLCKAAGVPTDILDGAATLAVLRYRGFQVNTPKHCGINITPDNAWYLLYHWNDLPGGIGHITEARRMFVLRQICAGQLGVELDFSNG